MDPASDPASSSSASGVAPPVTSAAAESASVAAAEAAVSEPVLLDGDPITAALDVSPVPAAEVAAMVDACPWLSSANLDALIAGRTAIAPRGLSLLVAAVEAAVATHALFAVRLVDATNRGLLLVPTGIQTFHDLAARLNAAASRPAAPRTTCCAEESTTEEGPPADS